MLWNKIVMNLCRLWPICKHKTSSILTGFPTIYACWFCLAVTCTLLLQLVIFIVAFLDVVEGYIHIPSPVKASRNSAIRYFNCHIQTADNKVVRAVCYSPKKRVNLQQAFQSKSPVHIKGVKRSLSKSFSSDKSIEEIQITKQAKITPTTANFQYNSSSASHLRWVT